MIEAYALSYDRLCLNNLYKTLIKDLVECGPCSSLIIPDIQHAPEIRYQFLHKLELYCWLKVPNEGENESVLTEMVKYSVHMKQLTVSFKTVTSKQPSVLS